MKSLYVMICLLLAAGMASASLVLRYNFDETTGTAVADSAGIDPANNATLAGAGGSSWGAGVNPEIFGNALYLKSGLRHATSGSGVALSNATGFTATAWVWLNTLPTDEKHNFVILQQLDGSGVGRTLLSVRDDGSLSSFAGGATTNGGAFTATGSTARLYELEVMATAHPLRVTEISPADGSSVVDTDCPMVIEFNFPVYIVDAAKVRLTRQADGVAAGGIAVSKEGGNAIRVCADLQRETTYVLRLDAGTVAASDDPTVVNAPVYSVFRVAAVGPEVADYSRTVDPEEPLVYVMDRTIELLDASKVRLLQLPEMTEAELTGISVTGAELTLQHGGLSPRRHYVLQLDAGALAGVFNGAPNAGILVGHYSGEFATMTQRSFENGWLQGFITNTSLGSENRVRAWSVFLNDQGGGPGYDFSFLGTNRNYAGDFAATPALALESGETYTDRKSVV